MIDLKKLMKLRRKAIPGGVRLSSEDKVLEKVKNRYVRCSRPIDADHVQVESVPMRIINAFIAANRRNDE